MKFNFNKPSSNAPVETPAETKPAPAAKPNPLNKFLKPKAAAPAPEAKPEAQATPAPAKLTLNVNAPMQDKPAATVSPDKKEISDLPEGFTRDELDKCMASVDQLRSALTHEQMIRESLREVMLNVQAHPQFVGLLEPEDIGLMVQGLREAYGVAITRKDTVRTKRSKNAEIASFIGDGLGDALGDLNKQLGELEFKL